MLLSLRNSLLFIASLAILCTSGVAMAADYAHELTVKKMTFSWTVNGDMLDIKLSAKTTGWVAVGFNPNKKMQGANIIIGYVKNGKVVINDEFGSGKTSHTGDTKQGGQDNILNKKGSESGGVTTLEFSIPMKSGDSTDTVIDPTANTKVILAYGGSRDSLRTRHTFRTGKTVILATGAIK
jgi:hypothetical protein